MKTLDPSVGDCMPTAISPPLSPAVSAVIERFLKALEGGAVVNKTAQHALAKNLYAQVADPEALRAALFKAAEPAK
jgi:hypothetical protein